MNNNSTKSVQSVQSVQLPFCPFPLEVFPESLRHYINQQAIVKNIDPAFIAIPILGVLASAIGNSSYIEILDEWKQISALWCLTVAGTGKGKSPGLDAALPPLFDLEREARLKFEQDQIQYKKELRDFRDLTEQDKAAMHAPKEPTLARYYTSNVTIESLASIHHTNPRGIVVYADEANSWLKSMNKYSDGGDESMWISMSEGKPIRIDRKTGTVKTVAIDSPNVSIIGGIQPGALQRALNVNHFDSGLMARTILCMPPNRERKLVRDKIDPLLKEGYRKIVRGLYNRPAGDPNNLKAVNLSDTAFEVFNEFFSHQSLLLNLIPEGPFKAFANKLDRLAARFALILYNTYIEADDLKDTGIVDHLIMAKACSLAAWCAYETYRVYDTLDFSSLSITPQEKGLVELPNPFTYQDVMAANKLRTESAAHKKIRKWERNKLVKRISHGHSNDDGNFEILLNDVSQYSWAVSRLLKEWCGIPDTLDTLDTLKNDHPRC